MREYFSLGSFSSGVHSSPSSACWKKINRPNLLHHILALSFAASPEDDIITSNIAGYICVLKLFFLPTLTILDPRSSVSLNREQKKIYSCPRHSIKSENKEKVRTGRMKKRRTTVSEVTSIDVEAGEGAAVVEAAEEGVTTATTTAEMEAVEAVVASGAAVVVEAVGSGETTMMMGMMTSAAEDVVASEEAVEAAEASEGTTMRMETMTSVVEDEADSEGAGEAAADSAGTMMKMVETTLAAEVVVALEVAGDEVDSEAMTMVTTMEEGALAVAGAEEGDLVVISMMKTKAVVADLVAMATVVRRNREKTTYLPSRQTMKMYCLPVALRLA
ncbi:unnamed protein product [Nesidiocoris tenuis]|uniref:Uncharacterized protein n=1 Tax=Nesidiocoris tenuis TaxID=355587 RepID=A0A6H5HFD5_9HEMI|nr:unnamed protein product [Nesidiocoris tenuis]